MNKTNPWNADVPFSYELMWLASDECQKSIQRKTSHDENLHWVKYCLGKYMKPALDDAAATKPRDQYRCLILGSNEGWIERLLCERGFKGQIIASDIADKALARAERLRAREGV